MTSILQQGAQFAFDLFNSGQFDPDDPAERGCLLWEDQDSRRLMTGPIFVSSDYTAIRLYSDGGGFQAMEAKSEVAMDCVLLWRTWMYWGDYHTHPRNSEWIMQFPSPQDLGEISVLYDLWPLNQARDGCAFYRVAPRLQLVQSCLFGDVFRIEPLDSRDRFDSLEAQRRVIDEVRLDYTAWYEQRRADWGDFPDVVSRQDFRNRVRSELEAMNATLKGRGVISFDENVANVQQEVDYGGGIEMKMD